MGMRKLLFPAVLGAAMAVEARTSPPCSPGLPALARSAPAGDGALSYSITVGGNYLRSTGGNDGTVNGRFYGTSHQGLAGVVERDDLTAAFGARR